MACGSRSSRGRGGGIRLMKPANEINIGALVRSTETDFNLVECFDPATDHCRLSSHCRLKGVLGAAIDAYLAVLDGVTLADLVAPAASSAARGALPTVSIPRNGMSRRAGQPVPGLPSDAAVD